MRFALNQPNHTEHRALVPVLLFILGVWLTVAVYVLSCRPRKKAVEPAAAAAAAAAAAPGSPAARPTAGAAAASPGSPSSPSSAARLCEAAFARPLQLPAASLLEGGAVAAAAAAALP